MGFRERWERRVARANGDMEPGTAEQLLPPLTIRVSVQRELPRSRRTVWDELAAPDGHPAWGGESSCKPVLNGHRGAVVGATCVAEFPNAGRYGLGMVLLSKVTEVAPGSIVSTLTIGPYFEYREQLHLMDTPAGTTLAALAGWATADPYVHDAEHLHRALTVMATEYLHRAAVWRQTQ